MRQAQRGVELALCAVTGQLFATGAVLRFGSQQQTVAGAEDPVAVGPELEAVAARLRLAVRSRVGEVALVELCLAVFG
ncbi:hypothetical protein D3C85_1411920 [compost metagenome]